MARQTTFTVDAESVQGIAGASITFRALKVGEWRTYISTSQTDADLVRDHVLTWTLVDDEGNQMPDPQDEPDILNDLYIHEQQAIVRLLLQGPGGESAKN